MYDRFSSTAGKYSSCIVRAGLLVLTVFIALFIGLVGFGVAHRVSMGSIYALEQFNPNHSESQESTPLPNATQEFQESIEINPPIPEVEATLTPWDGAGRVTILLLGLDFRDWESGRDYSRSDTMILLTLDPLSRTAGILSVPRDLWVAIPGFKHGKINTAYNLGAAYKLPGGGPGLAVKTVEQFLGVPINYYAQIDFSAFVDFIDEIGGVKIDVQEPITIDLLGSGSATKKNLQPGVQVLPGDWALAYARARYTDGGDFDRAHRQQQVIMAIRDRILSFDMLPILLSKADVLFQQLASGIHTNLELGEATKLAVIATRITDENIHRGVISEKHVLFGRSPDDLSILIPLIDKIHVLRDEVFASSGALGPLTPGSPVEKMIAESARVSVQNGTTNPRLEQRTAEYLQSLGVNVVEIKEAGQQTTLTAIQDNTRKPHTMNYLVDLLGIKPIKISASMETGGPVDIEIILGNDWTSRDLLP